MDVARIVTVLDSEMEFATGCTEPAAIAFTAAHAGKALAALGAQPERVEVAASIPKTQYTGIDYAASIGAFIAEPDRMLGIFEGATPEALKAADALVQAGNAPVVTAQAPQLLYIDVTVRGGGHFARAVVADLHTNLIHLETDQGVVFDAGEGQGGKGGVTPAEISQGLSLERIFTFIDQEFEPFGPQGETIRRAVSVNTAISQEGLRNDYGLRIGKMLTEARKKAGLPGDLATDCMIAAAAGADARMAGAPVPVMTNSGSGNQGITATMPVVAAAGRLGCGEEKMLRAVALSNLVAIYIKSKFGRLSALCGATVAGTGSACAITYLLGGGLKEIGYAVQNMAGNVVGMLCDGAKADCALKISTCINAAVQAALMASQGVRVASTDGIVEEDPEKTLENFSAISRNCSHTLDSAVIQMMLSKKA